MSKQKFSCSTRVAVLLPFSRVMDLESAFPLGRQRVGILKSWHESHQGSYSTRGQCLKQEQLNLYSGPDVEESTVQYIMEIKHLT